MNLIARPETGKRPVSGKVESRLLRPLLAASCREAASLSKAGLPLPSLEDSLKPAGMVFLSCQHLLRPLLKSLIRCHLPRCVLELLVVGRGLGSRLCVFSSTASEVN